MTASNRVEGFHAYTMPPRTRLYFDEQAGEEKVFIVFSREPEQDLEKIVYSLQGAKAKPVSQPATLTPAQSGQVLMASAAIENSMVGHLREAYARDLIVEKIAEDTPGDRKEKAVYVVNPTGSEELARGRRPDPGAQMRRAAIPAAIILAALSARRVRLSRAPSLKAAAAWKSCWSGWMAPPGTP